MTNQDFIDSYKSDEKIISDWYKIKDSKGQLIDLDGIISPLKIDNRQLMAPTDNQKDTPHCAAYSAATLAESIYWKRTGKLKQLDSHQIYALAKQLDSNVNSEGTYLECALEAAIKLCAFENSDVKVGMFFNTKCEKTISQTKQLLHKHDFLQVGFMIDEGWYDVTNNMYYIKPRGQQLGGHAVNLAGYDSEGVYVLNQWGTGWGANGYAIMKWDTYLKELLYGAYVKNAFQSC